MKNRIINSAAAVKVGGGLLAGMLAPGVVHACACGCGVFDVGTSSMFPNGQGGMAYLQYDYQNQNRNWNGTSQAPAANNGDKEIETHFTTAGVQYMFNDKWGAQVEIPYDFRYFKGTDANNNIAGHHWNQLGDIRVEGIYTGFFADSSAGVTFGLKLPTGSYTEDPSLVDRDTQLGTGSTDILLGGFYRGNITRDDKWDWFAQGLLDVPTLTQAGYRPGVEFDTAAGVDYKGFSVGRARISPVAQAIFSERTSDSGSNSTGGSNDDPQDGVATGYQRLLLSPGFEIHLHPVKIYADAEFPVFQHFTGDQLAAPVLFKLSVSYMF
jgi:hypothetical protein